jgi:lycopene beta-cyclase
MGTPSYNFAIIGAGAAGMHLLLKMSRDPFFSEKTILVVDKDDKTANDRTWSFWEKGITEWDKIQTKSWEKALFYSKYERFDLELTPYRYKMIRATDFYEYVKKQIDGLPNLTWVKDDILEVKEQSIIGKEKSYSADHIFDSRVPESFNKNKDQYNSLIQHFKGWFIETDQEVFDPKSFTMMDYRLQWKNDTSFTYILPVSKNVALVEFTLFNLELIEDDVYEEKIKNYIHQYLKIEDYTIKEVEKGVIPMSDYPFHKHHSHYITKIGTAGGWVRPSSGYSFKNADRYSAQIVGNIKRGEIPSKGIAKNRFRWYDKVFLNVLKNNNEIGDQVFTRFYSKHPIERLFKFLDEESLIIEDIKIILSLNRKEFRNALFNIL